MGDSRWSGRATSDIVTRRVVYTGSALYATLLSATAAVHFYALEASRQDLGNMVQALWSTAHGRFLETTTVAGHQLPRLAGHVDPFLALLTPFWWVWPSPLMLLVVQALAVSTGALPVYWLARKHLRSPRPAAYFAFAYLLFPATQFNTLTISTGFHPVAMAIPLILFGIWFLDEERLVAFALVALLAATTKEEIPAAVGLLGLWYAARKGHRVTGLVILVVGMGITLFDFLYVIPHFSPSGVNPFAGRYEAIGGTPSGMLHTLVSRPWAFAEAVATTHKLAYLAILFVPFLGLCLLEPLMLLGAVPDLAVNLLSGDGHQTSIVFHYTAGIVPFLVAASVLGAARLRLDRTRLALYVLACVAFISAYSPVAVSILAHDPAAAFGHSPDRHAKAEALVRIPASVPVSASIGLGAYLSARRYVYTFPRTGRADWVVVDRNDPRYRDEVGFQRALRRLRMRDWKLVFSKRGIEVWHKIGSA